MADDQRRLLAPVEQPAHRRCVAVRRRIQALTAAEAVASSVLLLPGPAGADRGAVEGAGVDFVQIGVNAQRDASVREGELDRLSRAQEAGTDRLIDLEVGELLAEQPGLLLSVAGQVDLVRGIAVQEAGGVLPLTRRGGRR